MGGYFYPLECMVDSKQALQEIIHPIQFMDFDQLDHKIATIQR